MEMMVDVLPCCGWQDVGLDQRGKGVRIPERAIWRIPARPLCGLP